MLSFIRRRLTVANGVLVIAVLLAMSGGAYAASKLMITSIKEISPKVVKQLKGERGERGPSGEKGATGSAGARGETGAEGKAAENVAMKEFTGKSGSCNEGGLEFATKAAKGVACNGAQGTAGKAGETPAMKVFTGAGGGCNEGGVEFSTAAGKASACSGAQGTAGKAGETPAMKEFTGAGGGCNEGGVEFSTAAGKASACNGKSAGGTLEQGKTERGTFAMFITAFEKGGEFSGAAPISFPIPVATSALPTTVEVLGEKQTSPNCTTRGKESTAAEGVLCVYISRSVPETGALGAPIYQSPFVKDPYGYVLFFTAEKQASYAVGEWALTAS